MSIRKRVADNLRLARLDAGLSVEEVGQQVGKSPKTISAWEVGRGQPDADMLILLCDIYNIESVSTFYGEDKSDDLLISSQEQILVENFRALNEAGQENLLEYSIDLTQLAKYKKDTEPPILQEKEA